jgi:hypothetical protein
MVGRRVICAVYKYDEGDVGWASSTLGKDERFVQNCGRKN